MIRQAIGLLAALAPAAPTLAQDLPTGCFARDYTAQHLQQNPGQNVAAIRLNFLPGTGASGDVPTMEVLVRLADQGRARAEGRGGAMLAQTAYCFAEAGQWTCGVECDGGVMRIGRLSGDTLEVTTDYFLVGDTDECGGAFDLAEDAGSTTYRLKKAAASACLGG
ncbi:hypothetical protein G5B31_12850 [Rhodobacter sp. SGA-6-6]|uniref:hypothetical protein n=1 Tax=Rhodobacter sp. SGA-6-6 TaxID=2710882 RepID=UPI0013EAB058|nr:hypothetical protein [Rhodobacter sp. SGA-6-6]NGM46423.1 hypothetical protein [Rhodobacter sp. SGA-6-6]